MLSSLWKWLQELVTKILQLIGFDRGDAAISPPPAEMMGLSSIFVRTNLGEKVHLQLSPEWTVAQVKEQLSPQLNTPWQSLRIIFAGKELPDNLVIGDCDLGQNSILHAVRVVATRHDDQLNVVSVTGELNTNIPSTTGELNTNSLSTTGELNTNSRPMTGQCVDNGQSMTVELSDPLPPHLQGENNDANVSENFLTATRPMTNDSERASVIDGTPNDDVEVTEEDSWSIVASPQTIQNAMAEVDYATTTSHNNLSQLEAVGISLHSPIKDASLDIQSTSAVSTGTVITATTGSASEQPQLLQAMQASSSVSTASPGASGSQRTGTCQPPRLLCDASTVMTIQLTKQEQEQIKQLKEVSSSGERAHFYVYCVQPCAGVNTGKLRVRCGSCKQGAITLARDPTCWGDVLNANTMVCHCTTPGCGSDSGESCAEFYFKCGGHVTTGEDDVAVALYMIRANLPGVLCLSCGDVATPVIVFECEASHVMCIDCFITYCLSKLSERQFTHNKILGYTLPCPVNCLDSLIREVHHFRLMGEDQYVRYQHWATEEAVLAAGGVLCPKPGCGHGLIPDEDCIRITCVGGCGYVFCRNCLQDYHTGDCWQVDDSNNQSAQQSNSGLSRSFSVNASSRSASGARWDVASAAAINNLTKPCPACRTPTERSGGCMHMVCTRASCKHNWCWVCHTEWTRDCMASHWFG